MKLYELIEQISQILTPKTNSFFDYTISTSDNNGGFTRSNSRKKIYKLENFDIPDLDKVLVCFNNKFIEDDYYDNNNFTKIKMQIFYYTLDINRDIKMGWACGFNHTYIFDLKNKTYTYKVVNGKDIPVNKSTPRREKKLKKYCE